MISPCEKKGETSAAVLQRVLRARQFMLSRGFGINARLSPEILLESCRLRAPDLRKIQGWMESLQRSRA